MTKNRRIVLVVVMAGILGLVQTGQALDITINPSPGLSSNPAALAAFNQAAAQWESLFTDPITVTIDADLQNMGNPAIWGSKSSVLLMGTYSTIRNQMVADAADEPSNAIALSVPTAAQFSAFVPAGFGLNGSMIGTKANLKAMGFPGLDAAFGFTDATINFNSGFSFDFDNSNGVSAGSYDFQTLAAHELGHALGFVSSVDTADYYLNQGSTANLDLYPLDLFRFNSSLIPTTTAEFTNYPRSLLPNNASYFTDLDSTWAFSTGAYTGDGREASNWKDDSLTGIWIGLMDPTLPPGVSYNVAYSDIRALDLIGYEVAPVPEPTTMILLGVGLIGLAGYGRKRFFKK